jgi:hypothetical protein
MIAMVGVVLSLVVYLHASSLRGTMQAGELRTQIEATQNDAANIQAETEQRLADGRVERAAAAYGMVLVPSQAMRTLPISIPKDQQTPYRGHALRSPSNAASLDTPAPDSTAGATDPLVARSSRAVSRGLPWTCRADAGGRRRLVLHACEWSASR